MLKEKYESIRAEAARFARTYLKPWAQEVDRTGEYRPEVFRAVAEAGYAGMVHPKEYGGQGADYLSLCIVTEELCRVDPSASALLMGNTLSGSPLKLFGSEEQKRKYLRPLAAGEKRAAFALTEPEAGCDAANVQTTAVRDGDEYVINGHKRYIIMAPYADFFTVFCQDRPRGRKPRHDGLPGRPGHAGLYRRRTDGENGHPRKPHQRADV
jgi:Acyl-CoA dehydrogenases